VLGFSQRSASRDAGGVVGNGVPDFEPPFDTVDCEIGLSFGPIETVFGGQLFSTVPPWLSMFWVIILMFSNLGCISRLNSFIGTFVLFP